MTLLLILLGFWQEKVAPLNSTVDRWSLLELQRHSRFTGCPIIRWRKPFAGEKGFSASAASASVAFISNELVDSRQEFWVYFIEGAPVSLSFNANTLIGASHGVGGILKSLVFQSASFTMPTPQIQPDGSTLITLADLPLAVIMKLDKCNEKSFQECTSWK